MPFFFKSVMPVMPSMKAILSLGQNGLPDNRESHRAMTRWPLPFRNAVNVTSKSTRG